jgi:hypothetical protein
MSYDTTTCTSFDQPSGDHLVDDHTASTMPDMYENGFSDMSISVDLDGDGWAETIVSDLNHDGIADAYDSIDPYTGMHVIAVDTDFDGMIDAVAIDDDGDGMADVAAIDLDGDGTFETELDPMTGEIVSPPFDPTLDPDLDRSLDPTDPFDDASTLPESDLDPDVHGDPMAEIPYHQAQVGPNDCLPTSAAMVLSEALGVEVPQSEVVDLANELDLLGPNGMSLDGGVVLLEHYGLDAEVQTGSIDDLRTLLDNDTPVIIGLDADDLYGLGDQPFADDLTSGHAVVITGIDDEAGVVYINDPGFPDGAGVAVPLSVFEDAWVDSGNSMIVAQVDADDDTADAVTGSAHLADDGSSGSAEAARTDELSLIDLVLLPLRLVLP